MPRESSGIGWIVGAFVSASIASAVGLHPMLSGSGWMWLALGLIQVPVGVRAFRRIHEDGKVRQWLQPRWGDISVGMFSGLFLLLLVWGSRFLLVALGSRGHGWLVRAHEQAGAPLLLEKYWLVFLVSVLLISVVEEVVWRGVVLSIFEKRFGSRRAWLVTGLLYGLAYLPSLWCLRTEAGLNPLVIAVAVLAGISWSFLAIHTKRLMPSILSHAVFLWFVADLFRFMSGLG